MKPGYLFTSSRLGFRAWREADLPQMAAINADPEVMRFFPSVQSEAQTAEFIRLMQEEQEDMGFCYFAVDLLETGAFIGFIGLHEQLFESDFTPCVDIGWRLDRSAWGQGLATEGARRCLEYARDTLGLSQVVAMAPAINLPSIRVMEKAGLKPLLNFVHPKLATDVRLRDCVLYSTQW